jgi:hypothetical protein
MQNLLSSYFTNATVYQINDTQIPTGSDLVSLPSFEELLNNPNLIKNFMEQQGTTGVDYIEPTGPLGGGTLAQNY